MKIKSKVKWLIFVGAGKWQKEAIIQSKKLGFKVIGIDSNAKAEGLKFVNLKIISNNNLKIINQLRGLNKNYVGAISYCNDYGMILAAKIRKTFNLKGISEKISRRMINKIQQRRIWTKNKLPCPAWITVKNKNINFKKKLNKFKFPLIVKPSDSAGSRGITKVYKFYQVETAFKKAINYSKEKKVIIEEFFKGQEYTVESFCHAGTVNILTITKKYKVPYTNSTVANKLETIRENTQSFRILKKLAIRALKALEYNEGPSHTEILLNIKKNKKILVETSGRGGGFNLFDGLVRVASSENIIKKTIEHAAGKNLNFNFKKKNDAILKFFTGIKGVVKEIKGFDLIKKYNTKKIKIIGSSFVKKNQLINNSITDSDRLGYLLCWGRNKKQLSKIINAVEKKIVFKIDKK